MAEIVLALPAAEMGDKRTTEQRTKQFQEKKR
jgi:hypothetical protein